MGAGTERGQTVMGYTAMQKWQLNNFGKLPYFTDTDGKVYQTVVNCGCMGCGKTYIIMQAFGLYLLDLKRQGYTDLMYVFVAKTLDQIRFNMCNVLSDLFGDNFKYDNSKSSGKVCNARLFGFPIKFIGLFDRDAETRIRGLSNIVGAIVEEHTSFIESTYAKFIGRIRNNLILPEGYANQWIVSSTNPDAPSHWLYKNYIVTHKVKYIQWHHRDAYWGKDKPDGFLAYINNLKNSWRHAPAFYERYVLGRWKAAEGLVFSSFSPRKNTIEGDIDYSYVLRSWIAVDYGSNHKTSVQVHHMLKTGIRIIEKNITFTRTSVSTICTKIEELYDEQLSLNHVKTINIYVDSAAQAVIDQLREDGVTALNAKKDVMPGNTYVNEQFDSGMLIILLNEGTQELIDEIYGYKYKETPNAKDGEVVKIDDDCCDAMRYGVYSDAKYNNAY